MYDMHARNMSARKPPVRGLYIITVKIYYHGYKSPKCPWREFTRLMAYPTSLERNSAEAGLPGIFRWQEVTKTEEPGHVQVLEQVRSEVFFLPSASWKLNSKPLLLD